MEAGSGPSAHGFESFCSLRMPGFVYPLISWWAWGGVSFLATENNAAVNMCVVLCEHAFSSLEHRLPRSGIVESHGNHVFNFFEGLANCFPKGPRPLSVTVLPLTWEHFRVFSPSSALAVSVF